jgi:ribonuclease Z
MTATLIPLGTASAIPANGRHLSAFALLREGRVMLFDCGEGTQFRLAASGIRWSRIDALFISHFHGDHFFGVMGLLSTMALLNRQTPLEIVAPAGIERMMECLPGARSADLPFPVHYREIDEDIEQEVVYADARCTVQAAPLAHRIFVVGYRYEARPRPGRVDAARARELGVEPVQIGRLVRGESVVTPAGRRVEPAEIVGPQRRGVCITYCGDTSPCEGSVSLARDVDLLIHEATFMEEHREQAARTAHSTAAAAADIARTAGAKKLLLTHFSARYDDLSALLAEARAVFPETDVAEELVAVVVED